MIINHTILILYHELTIIFYVLVHNIGYDLEICFYTKTTINIRINNENNDDDDNDTAVTRMGGCR